MMTSLVVTLVGPDRPGLISSLSATATAHGANWLESHMANLAGQFAGIVCLQVAPDRLAALHDALGELESSGMQITIAEGLANTDADEVRTLSMDLLSQDQPGIVRDISQVLAANNVSIEELETESFSGSMSGEIMFKAKARLRVPANISTDDLYHSLESLSNELIVEVEFDEDGSDSG